MSWDELIIKNYPCGGNWIDFHIKRSIDKLLIQVTYQGQEPYRFIFSPAFGLATEIESVFLNNENRKNSHRLLKSAVLSFLI